MRLAAPAVALSLAFATVSSVGYGKRVADDQINPQSMALTKIGIDEASAGRLESATDAFESALAVDPRNRAAYVELASVARKQGLPGKAIRMYREALLIEPNDVIALSGQGEALVQRGAINKAKENLARIEKLCMTACPEQTRLSAAIAKPPEENVVSAEGKTEAPVTPEPDQTEKN
ncbi:MAG: tetratricopeptide repeat protein [Chakrabartia sp.]